MYQMFKKAGYDIEIKKILKFKHEAISKNYIEFLYFKKKQYSLEDKKAMKLIFKILMNSFYGSCLTGFFISLSILKFIAKIQSPLYFVLSF